MHAEAVDKVSTLYIIGEVHEVMVAKLEREKTDLQNEKSALENEKVKIRKEWKEDVSLRFINSNLKNSKIHQLS